MARKSPGLVGIFECSLLTSISNNDIENVGTITEVASGTKSHSLSTHHRKNPVRQRTVVMTGKSLLMGGTQKPLS